MKQQILILIFGSVLFVGCENSVRDNTNELNDPELQNLSTDLISNLNLSKNSADNLRKSLKRHFGKGRNHNPGFLWKVAADLQQTLTDEEKAALFERLEQHDQALFNYQLRGERFIKNSRMAHQRELQFIRSVLTDEQLQSFNDILTSYKKQFTELIDSLKSGSIKQESFRSRITVLREAMMAEIDDLLTEEQRAVLEDQKVQFEANREKWREQHQARQDQIQATMYVALNFSESQITLFEEIQSDVKAAIQDLRDQVKNGQVNIDAFRDSLKILITEKNSRIEAMLTAKQLEIVKIHLFLELRMKLWQHRRPVRAIQSIGYNDQQLNELKIVTV